MVLCVCFAPLTADCHVPLSLWPGLTDAADHWRCFLLNHGGLLPRHLREPPDALGAGAGKVRRKRK